MPTASKKSTPQSGDIQSKAPHSADWVDRLARLETHFGRFLWDILGVILIACALMTSGWDFRFVKRYVARIMGNPSWKLARMGEHSGNS